MKINKQRQSCSSRVARTVFVRRCVVSVLEEETGLVACQMQMHAHTKTHRERKGACTKVGLIYSAAREEQTQRQNQKRSLGSPNTNSLSLSRAHTQTGLRKFHQLIYFIAHLSECFWSLHPLAHPLHATPNVLCLTGGFVFGLHSIVKIH